MSKSEASLKLKKKKEMDFKKKKGRLSERKEFGVKMIGNDEEMTGD